QLFRMGFAPDRPAGSRQAGAPMPAQGGPGSDALGDVQPGQRRLRFQVGQRLVDGVVGADEEVGADLRQLVGRGKHQRSHTPPVAVVDALDVLGERARVHRDLRVAVGPEELRPLDATDPIRQRGALGRAGHDTDVLGHGAYHGTGAGAYALREIVTSYRYHPLAIAARIPRRVARTRCGPNPWSRLPFCATNRRYAAGAPVPR